MANATLAPTIVVPFGFALSSTKPMSAVSNANQSMSFTFRMIIPQESSLEVYDDDLQRLSVDRHADAADAADDADADADDDDVPALAQVDHLEPSADGAGITTELT